MYLSLGLRDNEIVQSTSGWLRATAVLGIIAVHLPAADKPLLLKTAHVASSWSMKSLLFRETFPPKVWQSPDSPEEADKRLWKFRKSQDIPSREARYHRFYQYPSMTLKASDQPQVRFF